MPVKRVGLLSGFQHTAARRRLPECGYTGRAVADVSTHSRAEAAAAINPLC